MKKGGRPVGVNIGSLADTTGRSSHSVLPLKADIRQRASAMCQGRHYTAGISSCVASAVLGSRPDEPFPLWREQPQNGRDQEQGRNIAHEMAVLSTVVKRLCPHDRRVHDDPSPPMSALGH